MENREHTICSGDIVIWLPDFQINDLQFSADFNASYLLVSYELMSKNNPNAAWGTKGFLFSKEHPVVSLKTRDFKKCRRNFDLLYEKYLCKEHHFYSEMVNLQLKMFVMEMWNIFYNEISKQESDSRNEPLFSRFLQLLPQYCMEHREVGFYASKLCISAKYLSEISKNSSGKTAWKWIEVYTKQRLIIMLRNPNLTLAEIADAHNFSSMSFFSRYVRKVLHLSPREYRSSLNLG